jgi:hypothetical protein
MNAMAMTTPRKDVKTPRNLKLTVELVPESSQYPNVRSHVNRDQWEEIKKIVHEKAGDRCEICGEKRSSIECHEVWEYDDQRMVQKLVGFMVLCPKCREVKHMTYAERKGRMNEALQHFKHVNGLSQKAALHYVQEAFTKWRNRNLYRWQLDLSYLKSLVKSYS